MSVDVELVAHHLLDFLEHGVLIDTPKGARGLGCNMLAHCVSLVCPYDGQVGTLPSSVDDRRRFLTSRRNLGRQALDSIQDRFPGRIRVIETKLRPVAAFPERPLLTWLNGGDEEFPGHVNSRGPSEQAHTEAFVDRWFLERPQAVVAYAREGNYSGCWKNGRTWKLDWENLAHQQRMLLARGANRTFDHLFQFSLVRLALLRYRGGDVRHLQGYFGQYPGEGGPWSLRAPSLIYYTTPNEQTPLSRELDPDCREHEGARVHVFYDDEDRTVRDDFDDGCFEFADTWNCDIAEIW